MNERLRILQLLEDGKINAEEAARLLEALSSSEAKDKKKKYKMWSPFETIPEIIASVVDTPFKNVYSQETLHYPKKQNIELKGISGNFEIIGSDKEAVEIKKDGYAKITEKDNTLTIKAISGDLRMSTPMAINVRIKGVSGDINIAHLDGEIEIASVSGNIQGEQLSGSFIGNFVSGNVDLDYQNVHGITITSKSGDVVLWLSENADAEIEIESKHGSITCDFELTAVERTENKLKGILNKPTAKVFIRNDFGDVSIRNRQ